MAFSMIMATMILYAVKLALCNAALLSYEQIAIQTPLRFS